MDTKKEQAISPKEFVRNLIKGATMGSVFDPDMTEEKVKATPEFSTRQVINHVTGKEQLSEQEMEELKRAAKYNRSI
ncbi:hypothetical protein H1230_15590 [Paenibacillus sp. 19GGS1-52]|uniref:hypothetical protein n=1 Tax=Paenibacillus sp. 19GGS1-52 TaxID=2758563 RepID=UPI001EFB9C2B|nr:hypothetical protein [Paenibacillus sp. 19GGS1-52]ULO10062.1 hypothetical protein H1230_15590 [Paenibacillus sp. 19GGS1-52]